MIISIGKDYGLEYSKLDVFDIKIIMENLFRMLNEEQQKNMIEILTKLEKC